MIISYIFFIFLSEVLKMQRIEVSGKFVVEVDAGSPEEAIEVLSGHPELVEVKSADIEEAESA